MVDDRLRLHDAARVRFDHDDCRIHARERLLRLFEEIDETGRVYDGDVDPLGRTYERIRPSSIAGARCPRLVIGDGRSVGDGTAPSDRARVRQDGFDKRRFAAVMGADESDIP